MTVDCFEINIIDTKENERSLLLESTEYSSPRWVYNGGDDEFFYIMSSEVNFNILVKENTEAIFLHLFTGSETRYKLQIVDVSDAQNHVILWEGFLLPGQFSEPYIKSDFFVEFTATDGIGRLKQKKLSSSFYRDKKGVMEILHQCLRATGLKQSIIIAPAIQNTGFDIDYIDLSVLTSSYDEDGKLSVYDILSHVLESIQCRLINYKQTWYVIGLNRFDEQSISAFQYDLNDVLEIQPAQSVTIDRDVLKFPFAATPEITINSPIKNITTTWERKPKENLIPEDVVSHYPVNYNSDAEDRTVDYWVNKTDDNVLLFTWLIELDENFDYNQLNLSSYYNGLIAFKKDTTKTLGPSVFFNTVNSTLTSISSFDTNYANLQESFYVYGSEDVERYATLKIEFFVIKDNSITNQQLSDALDNNEFENQFYFAITRRDYKNDPDSEAEIYLSNFTTIGIPDGTFDFDLSVSKDRLIGKLELEKVALTKDGWYNIRIYPLLDHAKLGDFKVYNELSFTLNLDDDKIIERDRAIDFTTEQEIKVFHSDSQMDLSDRRFVFSDSLNAQITAGTLLPAQTQITPISYSREERYNGAALWYYLITVLLEDDDYFNLVNGYQLYVKKQGTTELVLVKREWYTLADNAFIGGKGFTQTDYVAVNNGEVYVEATDEIYIQLNEDSQTTLNYPPHWLDKWRRYGKDESVSYLEAINRMAVDLTYEHSFLFSGEYGSLVGPLDLISFKYLGGRNYIPIRLELDLVRNRTTTMMHELNHASIDYVEDDPVEDVVVDPVITIQCAAQAPQLFVYNWLLLTNYSITGFDPINATLSAEQLTDSVGNGGVPTGLVKTANITTSSGVNQLGFPIPTGTERGWYKVRIEQDGVQSNIEYVEIDPVVTPPTEYITITKVETGDIFNRTGKYNIDFFGFTPTTVTQRLQEIDATTQSPIGLPVDTTIADHTVEQTITFTQSGNYKVTVLADGYESNDLAWFVIII